MTVVIDASVALKWFVHEDPATDTAARAQLTRIVEGDDEAVVPELFFFEVLAFLIRRLPTIPEIARAMNALTRLGLHRLALDPEVTNEATRLAMDHGLTGHDATYAALASSLDGTWVTFDAEAHRRVEGLGISELLG